MHYYGVRSALIPKEDLGIKYFSSSTNTDFLNDQIQNIVNYKYKIIKVFHSREEANNFEEKLHKKFDVANNINFYNLSNASKNFNFDVTGMVVVKDKNSKIFQVSREDKRFLSGELVHISTGTVVVKNSSGKILKVPLTDKRYLDGDLVHHSKGTVTVKDTNGNISQVSINDKRYLNGLLVHINKKQKMIYNNEEIDFDTFPMSKKSIYSIFKNLDKKVNKQMYFRSRFLKQFNIDDIIGKTYSELGFYKILI